MQIIIISGIETSSVIIWVKYKILVLECQRLGNFSRVIYSISTT